MTTFSHPDYKCKGSALRLNLQSCLTHKSRPDGANTPQGRKDTTMKSREYAPYLYGLNKVDLRAEIAFWRNTGYTFLDAAHVDKILAPGTANACERLIYEIINR
jgi:hypothetical protein